MTDTPALSDTAELVKRLDEAIADSEHDHPVEEGDRWHVDMPRHFARELRDRLETLQAEVERQRDLICALTTEGRKPTDAEVEVAADEAVRIMPLIEAERLSTPSPAAPWQAVPKEPTPEMVREALATVPGICGVCEADIEDVYATMLAAAPSAPEAKSEIVSTSKVVTEEDVERLCSVHHDAYEAAAKARGWSTNLNCRCEWVGLPDANKATMRAAMRALLAHLSSTPSPAVTEEELAALRKLLLTAQLLYQNAEGCAVNHHCVDFETQGLPGWLADCQRDVGNASRVLAHLSATAGGETAEVEREACAKMADNVAAAARRWRSNIEDYNSHEATSACTQRDTAEGLAAAIRSRASASSPVASHIACGEDKSDIAAATEALADFDKNGGTSLEDLKRELNADAARPRDGSAALRAQEDVTLAGVPKRLATRPDLDALLTTFVNHWGMDSYDPPAVVVGSVRQIVILALDASRDCAIAAESGVTSNPPPSVSSASVEAVDD